MLGERHLTEANRNIPSDKSRCVTSSQKTQLISTVVYLRCQRPPASEVYTDPPADYKSGWCCQTSQTRFLCAYPLATWDTQSHTVSRLKCMTLLNIRSKSSLDQYLTCPGCLVMTDRTRSGSPTPRHYGIRPTQTGKQQAEEAAAVGRDHVCECARIQKDHSSLRHTLTI